jgi:hypothetical protein
MLESPSCSILLPHTSFTFAARAGRSVDKDNPELLIVPSGPLTALPFHLLVTDKPAIAVPRMQINDMSAYRDAPWLVKRHAVTVLPSVASLKALRVFARKGQGTKPMIGFGDPVSAPNQSAAAAGQRTDAVEIAARTPAYFDYWRGASVDRARLADALSPLDVICGIPLDGELRIHRAGERRMAARPGAIDASGAR